MVRYGEYTKGYKLFDTSTLNTFIERSVQFEEEIIPYFELAPGECSSPQHHDELSNDSSSIFYDISDNEMDNDEISVDELPSRPKWDDKIIQAAGELAGNSLEARKTSSQFHNASFASEIALAKKSYMMIGSDPQSYQEYFHCPI